MQGIRKWQRVLRDLLATIQKNDPALEENKKALGSLKRPRLKEYNPQIDATVNKYSLVSIKKDTKEQKVVLQNIGENKRDRQRAEDNAKTHESLFILPKQSGFADRGA